MPTTTETRTDGTRARPLAATLALLAAALLSGGCDGGIFGTGDGGPVPSVDAAPPGLAAPQTGEGDVGTETVDPAEPPASIDTPAEADVEGVGGTPEPLSDIERRLIGRTWTLVSFERDDGSTAAVVAAPSSRHTLAFRIEPSAAGEPSRTVSGIYVCNALTGTYSIEGSVLSIDGVAVDDGDCAGADEETAAVVDRVLHRGSPTMVVFEDDLLVLRSAANEALRYATEPGEEGSRDPE